MPNDSSGAVRNIALVGHSGGGKTTLVEALLHRAGVIGAPGDVTRGNTVCDLSPLEKTYGHSLSSSVVSFDHGRLHLNLIDTPGMPDFIGQALAALPAVETVAVVLDAVAGVEPVTRRMLEWAAARKLCRMVIVNRIDTPGAECYLPAVVNDQERVAPARGRARMGCHGRALAQRVDQHHAEGACGSQQERHR